MEELAYAKINDCVDIIPSLMESQEFSARLEATLLQSLLDASRLIEADLSVRQNYFGPQTDFIPRTIYGDGTDYVRLDPYIEISSIKDYSDDDLDTDYYRLNNGMIALGTAVDINNPRGYYLKWNYGGGWNGRSGCFWERWSPLTVTARWGFACTPADIVMATKNMGCLMFLNNPLTRSGLNISSLDDNQEQRLRTTYNKVMVRWSDLLHHRQLGIA